MESGCPKNVRGPQSSPCRLTINSRDSRGQIQSGNIITWKKGDLLPTPRIWKFYEMLRICVFSYKSEDPIMPTLCAQHHHMDWHLPGGPEFFSSHPHALHLAMSSLIATAQPLHLKLRCTQRQVEEK